MKIVTLGPTTSGQYSKRLGFQAFEARKLDDYDYAFELAEVV
jgi:hypothetical protein